MRLFVRTLLVTMVVAAILLNDVEGWRRRRTLTKLEQKEVNEEVKEVEEEVREVEEDVREVEEDMRSLLSVLRKEEEDDARK